MAYIIMSYAEIKKAINSNLNVPLDELVKSGAIPIVKSVQRGVATPSTFVAIININEVNMEKSIVLLESNQHKPSGEPIQNGFCCCELASSTSIRIRVMNKNYSVPWQVIEFY